MNRNKGRVLVQKHLKERNHLGEQRGAKLYLNEMGWKHVDWTNLAQDRDKWWAVVDTVMNVYVA
jgi:hypothetical protein